MITASNVEKTHKVIKFDLEGHGLSPLSGQDLSIPVYANSVKEVLDNAGVKQAVVVAHSMGGVGPRGDSADLRSSQLRSLPSILTWSPSFVSRLGGGDDCQSLSVP